MDDLTVVYIQLLHTVYKSDRLKHRLMSARPTPTDLYMLFIQKEKKRCTLNRTCHCILLLFCDNLFNHQRSIHRQSSVTKALYLDKHEKGQWGEGQAAFTLKRPDVLTQVLFPGNLEYLTALIYSESGGCVVSDAGQHSPDVSLAFSVKCPCVISAQDDTKLPAPSPVFAQLLTERQHTHTGINA